MIDSVKIEINKEHIGYTKTGLRPEDYLNENILRYKRKALSRLRCGTLPLAIETGRYSKPKKPLEERLCTLCHLNAIESEVHFLIDCPLYDDLRTILVTTFKNNDPSFDNSPSIIKYITLMTSKHQHQLSNMVFNMCLRRKLFSVY